MKYLFVAMAVGAAALAGGSVAHAANNGKATQNAQGNQSQRSQSTDISAQHRHYHHHWRGHHYGHHWRHHGYYRPHYRSYGYYPRRGYYGGGPYGYYGGGPGVTFSFGTGGYRW
ncbi:MULTISPECIES: hypothetical protein [unclassified Bradyrhizobium]|uniref:hypothetical protein n=1 Tax=unclassified Bradyrhizobium TaxID=2631580 RepID=UPI0024797AB6|nr:MULTISPECIES: hypothetical protein [unclassified Bradyrhizobium]WGR72165.1 hypothetical protein MTX24_04230 [Bradyrhizobium sp. ISRA426]WGR76999.1 hypothetical protein MTX21_29180 [Bradyrhizobium sp. ISRA430]WGR87404.1 hypothetical protein MTX25_04230 [Bradyrhizobium sp. ISRA432]